jgi:hypothetical protein
MISEAISWHSPKTTMSQVILARAASCTPDMSLVKKMVRSSATSKGKAVPLSASTTTGRPVACRTAISYITLGFSPCEVRHDQLIVLEVLDYLPRDRAGVGHLVRDVHRELELLEDWFNDRVNEAVRRASNWGEGQADPSDDKPALDGWSAAGVGSAIGRVLSARNGGRHMRNTWRECRGSCMCCHHGRWHAPPTLGASTAGRG